MKKIILLAALCVLAGCVSARGTNTTWQDSALLTEQQRTIEQQRGIINDLGDAISTGAANLRDAVSDLVRLEDGNENFGEWLRRVDDFVRKIIEEQQRLESIQRSDNRADAGT